MPESKKIVHRSPDEKGTYFVTKSFELQADGDAAVPVSPPKPVTG